MSDKDFNSESIDSVISTILANQLTEKKLADDRHREVIDSIRGHAEAIKQLQGFRYYLLGGAAVVGIVASHALDWIRGHLK